MQEKGLKCAVIEKFTKNEKKYFTQKYKKAS